MARVKTRNEQQLYLIKAILLYSCKIHKLAPTKIYQMLLLSQVPYKIKFILFISYQMFDPRS